MKYPSYLNLSKSQWQKRIKKALWLLERCRVCPRRCGVNRLKNQRGFCQVGRTATISSFGPHFGEERCLIGTHGSGTIFMTFCNLRCIYCQNYEISQLGHGYEISSEKLAQAMAYLQKLGCHNINFVTPSHQVPQILEALPKAVELGLKIPLVYNTSVYDSVETLKLLSGIFDIYMPDTKYSDDRLALKYSQAPNYYKIMKKAISEMHHQVKDLKLKISRCFGRDPDFTSEKNEKVKITKRGVEGLAYRGLLIRHLVLPKNIAGTEKIMKFLASLSKNTFLNIMDQYRPCHKAYAFPPLDRQITSEEYLKAVEIAKKVGIKRIYI